MAIKSRVDKIEGALEKVNNDGLIEFAVVYMGHSDWRKREIEAARRHLEKHGNLNRLRIVRTLVPPPAPAPSPEALSAVWGESGDGDGSGSSPVS